MLNDDDFSVSRCNKKPVIMYEKKRRKKKKNRALIKHETEYLNNLQRRKRINDLSALRLFPNRVD